MYLYSHQINQYPAGFKMIENMLAKYDRIDVIFSENDSVCLGAQKDIVDAKRTDQVFLVDVDGQKEALLQILSATNYAATGLNNSDQIGSAAFHRAMAILAGGQSEKDNVVKCYDPNSVF